jgi:hypothetical protein
MNLLTLIQLNKLRSAPQIEEHLKLTIKLYINIARRVRKSFPEYHELDRVDMVIVMIKQSDPDIFGLDGKGMSVDEICEIFAREAVGEEEESKAENGETSDQ